MIPDFVDGRRLPRGGHICTWDEVVARFGAGERRRRLCTEVRRFLEWARDCGFIAVGIWGSFTTAKREPGDLDFLFVTPRDLDRDMLSNHCAELLLDDASFKARYGHNAFNCPDQTDTLESLVQSLSYDYRANREQGMIIVELRWI
jgi:hypothetical protein